jgi:hypothetical protein
MGKRKYGIRDIQKVITFVWRQEGLPAEFKVFVDATCRTMIQEERVNNKRRSGGREVNICNNGGQR